MKQVDYARLMARKPTLLHQIGALAEYEHPELGDEGMPYIVNMETKNAYVAEDYETDLEDMDVIAQYK